MTDALSNWKSSDSPKQLNHPENPENGLSFAAVATDIAKTGSTFIPGKAGIAASAIVYGLTEINSHDTIKAQLTELVTGAAKGVVMHELVHRLPGKSPALKGITLGLANRLNETALSYHTYFDQDDNFSFSQTARNYEQLTDVKSLAADAAVGAIAFGAAKSITPLIGETLSRSPVARNMLVGGVAGMAANGANEVRRESGSEDGLQPWEITKHALVGGITGGIGGASGYYAGRLNFTGDNKAVNFLPTAANALERIKITDNTPIAKAPAPLELPDHIPELTGSFKYAAALKPVAPTFQRDSLVISRATGDATQANQSQGEFARENIVHQRQAVRVYDTPDGKNGSHQIVVPEAYAAKLDEVRALHLEAASSDAKTAQAALEQLAQNPLRNRTLPEHAQFILDRLPDGGTNSRVFLLDHANPMDPWYRAQYKNPGFTSAASTDFQGNISLYKSQWGERVADHINHEWAHELPMKDPGLAKLHEIAVRFENGTPSSTYAKESGERLPVHVEDLLSKDGDFVYMAGDDRPIETSVLARGLGRVLTETQTPGVINTELQTRTDNVRAIFEPAARAKLAEALNSDNAGFRADAAKLLLHLDGHAELAKLQKPVTLSFAGETLTREQLSMLRSLPVTVDLSDVVLTH